MPQIKNSATQEVAKPSSWFSCAAAAPLPVLVLAIVFFWSAGSRTPHESPYLLMSLNFVFLTLVSATIAVVVARNFLGTGLPGLLLLSCGAMFWAAAGFLGTAATLLSGMLARSDPNFLVTLHNSSAWASAVCHLAGAALSLRWQGYQLRTPRRWLAGAIALVASVVGFVFVATLAGWTAILFIAGSGGTPVREYLLGSSIAMFVLASILLRNRSELPTRSFAHWYSLALLALATGLFGLMLSSVVGSVVVWLSRVAQYLGGGYMLAAALASTRRPDPRVDGPPTAHDDAWLTYGVAVAIVIAAAVGRMLFMPQMGVRLAFLTFYPAIMLVALYARFGAALVASIVAACLANYFWMEPPGTFRINDSGDVAGIVVFLASSILIAWIVEVLHRTLATRQSGEFEQRKLNRALRLLSDCNIALVHAQTKPQLLDDLCQIVVESGGYQMAWVGLAGDDPGKCVTPVSSHGQFDNYLDSVEISWDSDRASGRGPTGTAISTETTQICLDLKTDPRMEGWREPALARGYLSSIALPLKSDDRVFGALSIYSGSRNAFGADEIALLEEMAANVAYGLQSLRARRQLEESKQSLEAQVATRTADLAAAKDRIADFAAEQSRSIEKERRRLSREVHDQIGQVLTAIRLIVGMLPPASLAPDQEAALNEALQMGIATTRRITAELRPPLLDDLGLAFALEHHAKNLAGAGDLVVEVDVRDEACLTDEKVLGLFRIAQEALTNVLKHAHARTATISGRVLEPGSYLFEVSDDGHGFDPEKVRPDAIGLDSMRERAALLGGSCSIAGSSGHGTVVSVHLPIAPIMSIATP